MSDAVVCSPCSTCWREPFMMWCATQCPRYRRVIGSITCKTSLPFVDSVAAALIPKYKYLPSPTSSLFFYPPQLWLLSSSEINWKYIKVMPQGWRLWLTITIRLSTIFWVSQFSLWILNTVLGSPSSWTKSRGCFGVFLSNILACAPGVGFKSVLFCCLVDDDIMGLWLCGVSFCSFLLLALWWVRYWDEHKPILQASAWRWHHLAHLVPVDRLHSWKPVMKTESNLRASFLLFLWT